MLKNQINILIWEDQDEQSPRVLTSPNCSYELLSSKFNDDLSIQLVGGSLFLSIPNSLTYQSSLIPKTQLIL